jgi:hypothetical protein
LGVLRIGLLLRIFSPQSKVAARRAGQARARP